ncbi:cytochrome CBB3 [Sulfuricella sp. T08]|uniref:cytochrome D1 domain-containing protein n=1 Tax=Sulfuricella sp. T08 TaxID=1632857 RepID=UPI0006179F21|nr:cytochrome D1 domain-containing protein [Sulfuricella sp. T08]GAO37143.1 cytochrome CBB3 [Sulfuricella sp. T08]
MSKKYLWLCVSVVGLLWAFEALAGQPVEKNFADNCASCHGADRLGGTGPALLPENLERLRRPEAFKTIAEGRIASQMVGFAAKLAKEDIQALVDLIYQPLPKTPVWGADEIITSHLQHVTEALPDKPVFSADPLNLFVVVEVGDHHATILDGDKFEPIYRFPTRFALHGGPKFSPDGRFVYFASRDGWISKFDIYNLKMVAEVRAGINTRNLAVSGDGNTVLVGNYLPHSLVLLNAEDLTLIKVIPTLGQDGKRSRVSAVYQAEPRGSFVAALKDVKEVWEIPYGDKDFPVRRIAVDNYLDDFFFDQSYRHLISAARDGKKGQVIDLDSGKKVAEIDLPGMPHLGSGITWEYQGHPVMATPNLKEALVSVIDMTTWQTVKQIKTIGPGFFMRSHENTPYAWTDGFSSGNPESRDAMTLIDKRTLEVAHILRPIPGKTAAHVEFTRDGKYALVSVWEMDGALVIYDAATLKEVKRLPMKKPSGKYNVYNKITRSAGTSH